MLIGKQGGWYERIHDRRDPQRRPEEIQLSARAPRSGLGGLLDHGLTLLKNSTWRRRFLASSSVRYGPPRFFPLLDSTRYPLRVFLIIHDPSRAISRRSRELRVLPIAGQRL